MTTPTPSDGAIATLLHGESLALGSGAVVVEPLGATARRLLGVLWSNRVELARRRAADQVPFVRALYANAPPASEPAPANVGETPPIALAPAPHWRLHHLWCKSVRGIAPFGEEFEFPIGGESVLIYGPNGTGKSSLVNAVGWVLTGRVSTDCEVDSDSIPLYSVPKAGGRATKLCDWPVVGTLPHGIDPKRVVPDCTAVLVLRSADGTRSLHLRRTTSLFEESADGVSWRPCPDLSAHGITPLDIQLSICAATVFGRRSLESSPDTRHLLSMMLGYDALEELGGLVTGLGAALTRAANAERENIAGRKKRLLEPLSTLPGSLRPEHPILAQLTALAEVPAPTVDRIEEVRAAVVAAAEKAEAELAGALGIDAGRSVPAGLADAATAALAILGRPVPDLFPGLATGAVASQLSAAAAGLEAFERSARTKIAERLGWWRQESEPASRAGLLIQAATYFEPDHHRCPVCEQSVEGAAIERRLAKLKNAHAELRTEVRVFFRDLADAVERIVPASIRALAVTDPAACIRDEWEQIKRGLGSPLAGVVTGYDPVIAALAAGAVLPQGRTPELLPADSEAAFREAAAPLEHVVRSAWRGVVVADWVANRLPAVIEELHRTLTSPEADSDSLHAVIARGKYAAADAGPLAKARDILTAASQEATAITEAEAGCSVLDEVRAALDEVKGVGKYAEAEVEYVFGGIKDATADHFANLYPYSNPDLVLARLHLNKGRDKSVEAYLAAGGFEFPGQHVANAGCIRAVALAFYFALLGRHPGGLGFVLMDDPILSLDKNHREAWASNVLRPCLATTQVILATHQRQFLINCRTDFRPGRIVELNPRTRSRQITWRPGDRLQNAERMLETDWNSAPVELRKYREELLITLDAYSPTSFFSRKQLKGSLDQYAALTSPHPLAGPNKAIADRLRDEKVARVLDPGSHAGTEADVTAPMVRICLRELEQLDVHFRRELDRLEEVRLRELRSKTVSTDPTHNAIVDESDAPPPVIPLSILRVGDDASWWDPLTLAVIGTAAAQSRGCVVDLTEPPRQGSFPAGGAVLVVSDALAPLARPGQWALLAETTVRIADGDYAAVIDQGGNHYLRRVWSAGDTWLLEGINPLTATPPVKIRKCACVARKVTGVCYADPKAPKLGATRLVKEWHTRQDVPRSPFGGLHGVAIRGTSLEPIARDGDVVLVGRKVDSRFDAVNPGGLAVVETDDPGVGNVIKRVYPGGRGWVLLSPNPVEPRDPLTVAKSKLRAIWPVQGVLFTLPIHED